MVTVGQLVAGRYRVLHPIGEGGMSRVFLAHDEADDAPVAIKRCTLPDGLTPDEQDVFRVWTAREARSFALVDHPNVVRPLDVLHDDEAPWIVMEFVPSRSLQQVLDESGPLPPARVAGIGLAVLEGLLAVRRAGLLHLDVKPSNVLIADDGRVMLSDFGPAVSAEGVRALAGAGIVLGSPKYLAPERLLDGIALPESDLWSLGATLYHAVEGRPPFVRPTTVETLRAVAEETPEPPTQAGPLTEVIVALLRRNPANRPEPPMVEYALRAVTGQPADRPALPPAKAPGQPAGRPGRRRVAVAATLVGVLVALIAVVALVRPDNGSGTPAAASLPSAPSDYYWYTSPGGSRVMLPLELPASGNAAGDVSAGGTDDRPRLEINIAGGPQGSVLETLTSDETTRSGGGGYRRLRIEDTLDGGAEWEYLYTPGGFGSSLHGIQRVVVADGRLYRFTWETTARTWPSEVFRFRTIVQSFQPPPGS
ncbi:protein kinase [Actinoplanes sp. NPDC026619]|uniref:protein kinase domain-containing protein n=1 Tax=Actinoplanes sp. NPDC026619 TaxID=3155798 RepID=UPI0034025BA6